MFGGPVWQEMARFEQWLMTRFYWPLDIGKWDRFIQLNSADRYEGYENFLKLYSQFVRKVPDAGLEPLNPKFEFEPDKFDFYQLLYAISTRPGMYLGWQDSTIALAAYLAGYFEGKKARGLKSTADEKEFLRFEGWLWRSQEFKRRYPWYRLVSMWPYGGTNPVENFFTYFDAYLTDYGKKPRGLEDLFEVVRDEHSTRIERRHKLPKRLIPIPGSGRSWRQERRNS